MNTNELRGQRIRQGKSAGYMAKVIGKSEKTYRNKESGICKWEYGEVRAIQKDMGFSTEQTDFIFLP